MTTNSDAKHEKIERAERATRSERHKVVPRHPHKLRGSKWTSVGAVNKELHWEVIEYHKRSGSLVLRALLTKNQQKIDWRELRDRDKWLPGWQPSPTVD